MTLEATMLIVDNSEYMRNGDYAPSRLEAQADAVGVIFQTKIDANPESTVGIMSMAGKGPEVLVTHTKDQGPILNGVRTASQKVGGEIDIPTALAVAQLALKHRENKNLRQRIIVFVGSPTGEGEGKDEESMIKLAKKLKKNNVAVDIVAFGDGIEGDSARILKAFVDNVNSSDNSHLLSVAPGPNLLSDTIISSAILADDRSSSIPQELGGSGAAPAAGPSAANEFEFGVDPSLDPELAMALRMSMQEAQAREAAASASAPSAPSSSTPAPAEPASSVPLIPTTTELPTEEEEEQLLQQALAMSTERDGEEDDEDVDMDDEEGDEEEDDDEEEEEEDEDAAIARAIEMSMQTQEEDKSKAAPKKK